MILLLIRFLKTSLTDSMKVTLDSLYFKRSQVYLNQELFLEKMKEENSLLQPPQRNSCLEPFQPFWQISLR
jgi:hypothetical protein